MRPLVWFVYLLVLLICQNRGPLVRLITACRTLYVCVCVYVYVYIYIYIYIYIYVCIHIRINIYIHIHTHTHTHVNQYQCVYVCVCIYIYIYIHTYVYVCLMFSFVLNIMFIIIIIIISRHQGALQRQGSLCKPPWAEGRSGTAVLTKFIALLIPSHRSRSLFLVLTCVFSLFEGALHHFTALVRSQCRCRLQAPQK